MSATLHIEHAITDLATWKAAFDRHAALREQAGVRGHTVCQPYDDERAVVIDLEFDDVTAAQEFLEVLRTRVWADRESSPALAGAPRTSILLQVG